MPLSPEWMVGLCLVLAVVPRLLVRAGLVTPASLQEKQGYAIVGILAVTATITPPDPLS